MSTNTRNKILALTGLLAAVVLLLLWNHQANATLQTETFSNERCVCLDKEQSPDLPWEAIARRFIGAVSL